MSISLTSNFFANARGLTLADGGGVTWAINKNTNAISATVTGASTWPIASGFGTPVGGAVIANYNITDAGGANSNTNKCVAEILAVLKSAGIIAT